jgi:hypothetical protein
VLEEPPDPGSRHPHLRTLFGSGLATMGDLQVGVGIEDLPALRRRRASVNSPPIHG